MDISAEIRRPGDIVPPPDIASEDIDVSPRGTTIELPSDYVASLGPETSRSSLKVSLVS